MNVNEFNANKYKQKYNEEHYKRFVVNLKKEEFDKLEQLLKKKKMTKSAFLKEAIYNIERQ